MSYQRDARRLLTGSMNLLGRGDTIPIEDSNIIQDFSYDESGNLRTRYGSTPLANIGSSVQTILPGNKHLYAVGGGQLYRDFSTAITPAIGPNSICSFQGQMWSITPGADGVGEFDDGTNVFRWIPKAPTTPVTGVASDVNGTILTDFGEKNWVIDPTDPTDGPVTPLGTPPEFQVQLLAGNTYICTLNLPSPVDLSTFHVYDKHHITMFFKQARNLGFPGHTSGVTFQVDCNDGSFTQDYFVCELPRKFFKGFAPRESVKIRVRMQQAPNDSVPSFTRVGTTPGKGWNSVVAIRIILDANANSRVRIGRWQVVGNVHELIEGNDIQYYATFVSKDGHESNPSPISGFISADRQAIQLTNIPVSTDPQVVNGGGVFLYRTGGLLGAVYRVTGKPLPNGTTTYHDDNGNSILFGLDEIMENDNNDPPPAIGLAGPYYGRLLAYGGTKGSRFYWTKQNRPYAFRNPDGPDGAWNDVGDDGDVIQYMSVRPTATWIYKQNTIWILYGDPDGQAGVCQQAPVMFGATGPNAVAPGPGYDFFVGFDGLYTFNGYSAQKLSDKVDAIFKGRTIIVGSTVIPPITNFNTVALGCYGDRVYLSYTGGTLVYHVTSGRFVFDSRIFTTFGHADKRFLAGQASGAISQLEIANNIDSQNLIYTKSFNAGTPDTDKVWEDFTIDSLNAGLQVTAFPDFNFNNGITLGTTNGGREVFQFNSGFGIRARSMTVQLIGGGTNEIYGMWINEYLAARDGKSYDTDALDFGTIKMKRNREAIIDIESPNGGILTLLTDHPGTSIQTRTVMNIPAGTRRMEHLVFPLDFVGYLHRHVISGVDIRVWKYNAFIQPIGTFLLGSKGEFWKSDPLDWGTERIKLLKEIEIVYAATQGGVLVLESDQPSTELQGSIKTVRVIPLPPTFASPFTANDEAPFKIRLPNTIKGREHRITVNAADDLRIESIRLYAKIVGEVQTTSWQWISLPVPPTDKGQWHEVALPADQAA